MYVVSGGGKKKGALLRWLALEPFQGGKHNSGRAFVLWVVGFNWLVLFGWIPQPTFLPPLQTPIPDCMALVQQGCSQLMI